jgi:hypothetical protein
MDGAALALVSAPIELRPLRSHTLRCAADGAGRGSLERQWSLGEAGVATVRSRAFDATYDGPQGARRVMVAVVDALGHPVPNARLRAEVPAGYTAEPLHAGRVEGTYETVVRWSGASVAGALRVFVDGETDPRATVALDASTPPPAPSTAPVSAPSAPHVGLELAFSGAASITFDPRFRTGLGLALDARARLPAGPGLLLGLRGGYTRFGCSGPALSDPSNYCPPADTGTPGAPQNSVGVDTFSLGPVVGTYFARHDAPVTGYLALSPQWIFHRSTVTRADGTTVTEASSTFSALALLGAQLRIGPGGLFAELGYTGAVAQTSGLGPLPIGGLLFALGYRALF